MQTIKSMTNIRKKETRPHLVMKDKTQEPNGFQNSDVYRFWVLLHRTERLIYRVRENELKLLNATFATIAQAKILRALCNLGEKATISDLAKRHYSNYHNVAALVKRMEKKGYVIREQSPEDEHTWEVSITNKGKKFCELTANSEELRKIVSILSKKERDEFVSQLNRLYDSAMQRLITQETSRRLTLD